MKAAVDTFHSGLSDLTAFLRNAERESSLAALLLNDERFASLTATEQGILSEISKAATGKRQYLYAVSIVGLYGLLERFVDRVLEAYIEKLCLTVPGYDQLPEAIRKNHLPVSIELLKAINEDRYRGDAQVAGVIANLHSCMTANGGFRINGGAFVLHRGNIKLDKIRGFLTSLGIDGSNRRLLTMPSFDSFFSASDPPRDVHSLPDQDLNSLLSPINALVDRRNEIAHGFVDDIESVDLLLSRCDFLTAFVKALHERLHIELIPYEVASNGTQDLGKPIATYGGKVACFESATCQIAVGDSIVAATEDSLMPYRWGKVLNLQVDHVRQEKLHLSELTKFGIEVTFKVRDNHRFYLLRRPGAS